MAGYPPGSGYPYGPPPPHGAPPLPYGAPPQPQPYASAPPYGGPPASAPYAAPYYPGDKPPKEGKPSALYAAPSAPPAYGYGGAAPSAPYGGEKPPKEGKYHDAPGGYAPQGGGYGYPPAAGPPGGYGSPFASLVPPPSGFPPGTDPNVVACFQAADADGSGFIDDKELQQALSSYDQAFSMRTVHLLMHLFNNSNVRKIGPKEFSSLFYSLQNWRAIFERFDRDRSGRIDPLELRDALLSLGFAVSQPILDLLVSKFDKSGGKAKAIEYDNFIECCLTVKGLTEKFKEKDTKYSGSATFTYESFMLTILPFIIA